MVQKHIAVKIQEITRKTMYAVIAHVKLSGPSFLFTAYINVKILPRL